MIGEERRLFSEAIAETLKQVRDFEVVEIVNDSKDLIPTVLRVLPSVTLLGSGTGGEDDLSLADELRAAAPGCGVAIIGADPTRSTRDHAPASGVFRFVPDDASLTQLVRAIRGLDTGPESSSALTDEPSAQERPLSDREREVLRLTADGSPIREIAAELFLSPGTVRNLTSSAIKKMGGRNRFDAACIAGKRGWL